MTLRKILATIIIVLLVGVSIWLCLPEKAPSKLEDATDVAEASKLEEANDVLEIIEIENVDDFALSTNITASSKGSCFLFTTYVEEEYVDFIENLDREKYGIVDITIQPETFKQGKCFLITYIQKSNETQ